MSVVKFVSGLLCSVVVSLLIGAFPSLAQDSAKPKKGDTFFSGTVTECTTEKISVERRVSGKQENHTFHITAETRVDGKLLPKVRVTVQYTTDEDGEHATRIVVRSAPPKK